MPRHIPLRQCIGCREMKPKNELIRIVHTPENAFVIDSGGKQNGRGAYICQNEACFKRIVKSRALNKVFSSNIPSDLIEDLEARIRLTQINETAGESNA